MKKLLLLSAAAMLTAGSAIAQVTEPTLTQVWQCTTGLPTAHDNCRQATGYNGKMYALDRANKQVLVIDKDGVSSSVYASNDAFVGAAITSDDKGNLLVNGGQLWGTTGCTNWSIVPASDPTNVISITATIPDGVTGARVDEVGRVVGDMMSAEGAVVYFSANGETEAVMMKISNGQFVSATPSSSVSADYKFSSATILQPSVESVSDASANSFYWRNRGVQSVFYLNDANETKFNTPTDLHANGDGFDVFTLNDIKYVVAPAMGTETGSYGSAIVVAELENGTTIAKINAKISTTEQKYYTSFKAEKVSETKANIYFYSAATSAAMYTFEVPAAKEDDTTAIESVVADNAAVEYFNLQGVKVANPQNGLFIKKQGNKAVKVVL